MYFGSWGFQRHARRSAGLVLLVLLSVGGWAATAPRSPSPDPPHWAKAVRKLLQQPDQARGFWGVYVYSLDRHHVLFNYHGDQLYTPASNTKLFTTAAALALIGPDYRFHTTVESAAAPDQDGIVHGDLILVGRGDPNLSGRPLPYSYPNSDKSSVLAQDPERVIDLLADQVQQRGVREVMGDVVGDDSYFSYERYPQGWAQDDLLWGYGAAISALCVDDNSILLHITPGPRAGDSANVFLTPWAGLYSLSNHMTTVAAGGPRDIEITRDPDSSRLVLWGTIPAGSAGDWEELGVQRPALFAARLLKRALQQRGIVVYGQARAHHAPLPMQPKARNPQPIQLKNIAAGSAHPVAAATAAADSSGPARYELAAYDSLPLLDDLQLTDKVSQNLHAEMMLRLLGKLVGGEGSIDTGRRVRQAFLTQVGLSRHDYSLRDGSGLSRENLVQPSAIVQLLAYMDAQPFAAQFRSLLPIAGRDGSLADRFRGTPAVGRVAAKTGYVEHVYALSGYATTLRGRKLAFSIIVNNDDMPSGQVYGVMDEIAAAFVSGKLQPTS